MASASSSTSSVTTSTRPMKKHKFSRDQLLKHLQIIGSLSTPLPPELPISPPPTRGSSPAPGSKRKALTDADHDRHKRPRTLASRSEPTEDGELCEEQPTVFASLPVRRPRRGKGEVSRYLEYKDKYYAYGKMLKYSGDARFWSTYPPKHRMHRPLANPPPPNSPYHKHGNLIARLELVDALVTFGYAIWSWDYHNSACYNDTWDNITSFLAWCKLKWSSEDTKGEQEKAFLGLVHMIEAYINTRRFMYACTDREASNQHPKKEGLESISNRLDSEIERQKTAAADAIAQAAAGKSGSLSTPQMLPSPASASSANSTPTMANRSPADNNPSSAPPQSGSVPPSTPQSTPNHSPPNPALPTKYPLMVNPDTITAFQKQNQAIHAAQWCSSLAAQDLNIPILAKHFPMTWARIFGSSLLPSEEYEPDFEDEEGELYWPGQCQMGEGVGWLCLMGKSMVKEFGKPIGYKGIEGVIKKEDSVRGREVERDTRSGGPPPHRAPSVPPHLLPGSRHSTPSHHMGGSNTSWNGSRPPEVSLNAHKR